MPKPSFVDWEATEELQKKSLEALEIGIVDKVVPYNKLEETAIHIKRNLPSDIFCIVNH